MLLIPRQGEWSPPQNPGETVPVFNQRAAALGLTITFLVLAWLCTLMRLYTRLLIVSAPWWDDLFIVLTLISTTVGGVIFCVLQDLGMGRHIATMTIAEKDDFMKVFYIGSVAYPLSLTFIKIALLIQYLRIFEIGSRRRNFCKWLIGFTAIWGLFYFIPTLVPCYPISSLWDFAAIDTGTRRCWAFTSPILSQALGFYISHSVTTTILDCIIFLLPVHLFFQPDTQRRARVSLLCLFALGIIVNLCSICRLVYTLKPSLDALWDLTWVSPAPIGLASIEISLASICAALPVFWPVLKTNWGKILVTYEVKITREYGIFVPRRKVVVLPRTASSDRELTGDAPNSPQEGEWNPYVGDAKSGLGESETVVQSPAERPVAKIKKESSFEV